MAVQSPFLTQLQHESGCSPHWHIQATLSLGIILELNLLYTAHLSAREDSRAGSIYTVCFLPAALTVGPTRSTLTGSRHGKVGSVGGQAASTTYELAVQPSRRRWVTFLSICNYVFLVKAGDINT